MPIERLIDRTGVDVEPDALYTDLRFPQPYDNRPYTFVNMVSTVDGKIVVGPLGSTARGVGSATDQRLMRRLQQNADSAVVGAGTVRAGAVVYRPEMWRAVVTTGGDLPLGNRFFTDAPDRVIIFAPASLPEAERERLSTHAAVRAAGDSRVDVREAARILRQEFGIRRLALEGGAGLNFEFFAAGLVDELFLTFAPKLKGGSHLPTIVEGAGLPDWEWIGLELVSLYHDGDELYFRYRVGGRERV